MIQKLDYCTSDRRILKFPAIRPCEIISPATLLNSSIELSHAICDCRRRSKTFVSQRRNAREAIRQVLILSFLLEEIRDCCSDLPKSAILVLFDLHVAFQKFNFLLDDLSREGAKIFVLMKSNFVTTQLQSLIKVIENMLDSLPWLSIGISSEVRELVALLSRQVRRVKIEIHPEDETAMKKVMLVLEQFEKKSEPDPFVLREILGFLRINTWQECHNEIEFLEEEIRIEYSEGDHREVLLLSSLVGLLSYCRGVLFWDFDVKLVSRNQADTRGTISEVVSCLNKEDFRCPISLEVMTDPVTVSTGQTYDRASIVKWLKSGNSVCPKTGEKLTSTELFPNIALKNLIRNYCAERGISLEKWSKKSRDTSRTTIPESAANAEAIKLLSEYLAVSLGYGSCMQQNKAAYEVRLLSKSNLSNRFRLINSGCIPPLIELLKSSDPMTEENSISSLLKLSKDSEGQRAIIENRGLNPILKLLKNGIKPESKQIAAATIYYLSSENFSYRKMIGENIETIPALLQLIKDGTPCGKQNSLMAIYVLLYNKTSCEKAVSSGLVQTLLNVLNSSERSEVKTDVLAVLYKLAETTDGSFQIMRASALPLILRLLQSIDTSTGKEYCVSVLHSLCINCERDVVPILATDAALMTWLYSLLTDGSPPAIRKARSMIAILQKFCETSSSRIVKA